MYHQPQYGQQPPPFHMRQDPYGQYGGMPSRYPQHQQGYMPAPQQPPMQSFGVQEPTRREKQDWLDLFHQMDVDRDGVIPLGEMTYRIQSAAAAIGMSPKECDRLLHDADKNRDKLIDFGEFCTLMAKAKNLRARQAVFLAAKAVVPKSQREEKLSYLQHYTCCPPPLILIAFSLIEIGIYIWYVIDDRTPIEPGGKFLDTSGYLIYNPCKREEAWRFLSYALVHTSIYHIIFNVLIQLIMGIPLELVHQWRVAIVYLVGVAAGSMSVSITDPNVFLAGASGGVYALMAAHLSDLVLNWAEMEYAIWRFLAFVVVMGADTGYAIYNYYLYEGSSGNRISYVAHFGGTLAGFLMAVLIFRNLKKKTWETVVWWICLVLSILLVIFAVLWNILYTERFPDDTEFCTLHG